MVYFGSKALVALTHASTLLASCFLPVSLAKDMEQVPNQDEDYLRLSASALSHHLDVAITPRSLLLDDLTISNHNNGIGQDRFHLVNDFTGSFPKDGAMDLRDLSMGRRVALSRDSSTAAIAGILFDLTSEKFRWIVKIFKKDSGIGKWDTSNPIVILEDESTASFFESDAYVEIALSGDGTSIFISNVKAKRFENDAQEQGTIRKYIISSSASLATSSSFEVTPDSNTAIGYYFAGLQVAAADDSNTAVVGIPYNQKVELIDSTGNIELNFSVTSASSLLGRSVAISKDGTTIAASAPGDNKIHIARKIDSSIWTYEEISGTSVGVLGNDFGSSLAINEDGTIIAIGSKNHDADQDIDKGSVTVMIKKDAVWVQLGQTLTGERGEGVSGGYYYVGDKFGESVGLSEKNSYDGTGPSNTIKVVIGAPKNDPDGISGTDYYNGHVEVYEINPDEDNAQFSQIAYDIDGGSSGEKSGTSVAIDSEGKSILIGSPGFEASSIGGFFEGVAKMYEQTEYSAFPSDVPSSVPSLTMNPSSTPSTNPSVSSEPSSQPSLSLEPSQTPSISALPSFSPTVSLHPSFTNPINVQFSLTVGNAEFTSEFVNRLKKVFKIILRIPDPTDISFAVATSSRRVLTENTLALVGTVSVKVSEEVIVARAEKSLEHEFAQEFNGDYSLESFSVLESESPSVVPSFLPSISSVPSSIPSVSVAPSVTVVPSVSPSESVMPSSEPSDSSAPSSSPSVTMNPSSVPSGTSVPSVLPSVSIQPSIAPSLSSFPSLSPSVSLSPSLSPSAVLDKEFQILSTFEKFDLTKDWCLTTASKTYGSKLHVRPCRSHDERAENLQLWKFTSAGKLTLAGTSSEEFCVESSFRLLKLGNCGDPNDTSLINFDFNNGSVTQTRGEKVWQIGFDPESRFERLRLYRSGALNDVLDKWDLRYSYEFPSDAPSNVVIDFPAVIAESENGKFYGIDADDKFGHKTELSADGSTLIVNSAWTSDSSRDNNSGDRYSYFRIYKKDTNSEWSLIKELRRLNGGWASAKLSRDGNIIALGERYYKNNGLCGDTEGAAVGRVQVFELSGTTVTSKGQTIVGDNCSDYAGFDIDLSLDGNVLVYSTRGHWNTAGGKVFVHDFDTDSNQWVPRGTAFDPIPNVQFPTVMRYNYNSILRLSEDGSTIMVGQPEFHDWTDENNLKSGSVRVYSWDATLQIWGKIGSDLHVDEPNTGFAYYQNTMTMNRAKNLIAFSAITYGIRVYDNTTGQWSDTWDNRKGKVWIYELKDGDWSLHSEIRGQGKEYFGHEIYMNSAGNVLAVAGNAGNVARIFHYENGSWNQKGGDLTGDEKFGQSISMDETGRILAASDQHGRNTSGVKTGWVKVYEW